MSVGWKARGYRFDPDLYDPLFNRSRMYPYGFAFTASRLAKTCPSPPQDWWPFWLSYIGGFDRKMTVAECFDIMKRQTGDR